jgi:hypothetical protein
MKYRLLNEHGNRVIYVDTEKEIDRLISRGYHLDENYGKKNADEIKTPAPKKRKAAKKNEGQVED